MGEDHHIIIIIIIIMCGNVCNNRSAICFCSVDQYAQKKELVVLDQRQQLQTC
jgi:hypothetical protein